MTAGRPREPIDLLLAKGKKHLSRKEIDERRASELSVPFKNVKPPESLTTKKQREEFNDISEKLLALNIFTELDVDALARYILAKELWLTYTKRLKALLSDPLCDIRDISVLQSMQDRAYRQCVTSANELCLNISSRMKLVIPTPPEGEDDEL